MSGFVHLHCHTEYSLLDGAIKIKDLCRKAKDFGMPACAITDHGNLYGALNFYLECKKVGIKPIIGCEVYVCHDHTDKSSALARVRHHLVLLAKNRQGYQNLIKIVSAGSLEGFYVRPRVDKEILRKHSEGIIALSACLSGEIPRVLRNEGLDKGIELAREYADIFPDHFYLEIQENGIQVQKEVNELLLKVSEETGLPLVATNDCHYLNADDYQAHDVLLCIQTQAKVDDENRMRFDTTELHYKSPEEMEKDFSHVPEALENTVRIAEMVEDYDFDFNTYHFPLYELPEGISEEDEFRRLSREGLKTRLATMDYEVDEKEYWDRLESEMDTICGMGFPSYFLIVQDFINWAKNENIPVGPGRGSAAGSLVAYALRITNIDPLPYNLLFERFLNNERVSMPDIDVDFCEAKRQEVIEYVGRKYGEASVAQITTFGKMMAKGVVRDVGRALGMTFQETDRIAKLIPTDFKMTIEKAMEMEPELRRIYNTEPEIKKLLDTSLRLEGLSRHASIHAAGLVMSDKPMLEYLPLYRGRNENDVVTQFDMKMVEKVGLVKFDFLGLRNMTVIANTIKNIKAQGKEAPDMDTLPLDDPDTYRLYASGDTDGIFQVESSGMRQYLRQLRPTVFEDIIAMLALYRPGPLKSGMVDEFIKRKHGQVKVSYPLPSLEQCLKDTYGVIVYQEQVMQIAQIVAGYTLGGADLLRRAMGKKDPAAMAAERSKFVTGAKENKVDEDKANEIFDLMEKFAEYGFNKSHSAAYALISYQTAYLKAHYKTEFMAALLSSEMGDQDKLLKYAAACRDMGVKILSPDVQKSRWKFTVDGDDVVFGLGGIKNVGKEAVRELVKSREKDGPFSSLLDLCIRVPGRRLTKRVLENMIKAGACDDFGITRAGMFAALDTVSVRAQKIVKDKESNQISLFTLVPEEDQPDAGTGIGFDCPEQEVPEWTSQDLSIHEKEALGFYFSSHPLQPYRKEAVRQNLTPLDEVRDFPGEMAVRCGILITSIREILTKKGKKMAFCQIEDLTASGECIIFPKAYEEYKNVLNTDSPLYLEATISAREEEDIPFDGDPADAPLKEIKLICEKISLLEEACKNSDMPVYINMRKKHTQGSSLMELKSVLGNYRGQVPVHIVLQDKGLWCTMELGADYKVDPGPDLDQALALWAGAEA